jgi:hypothetical protein
MAEEFVLSAMESAAAFHEVVDVFIPIGQGVLQGVQSNCHGEEIAYDIL